jgi:hypothetical protein
MEAFPLEAFPPSGVLAARPSRGSVYAAAACSAGADVRIR